MSKIKILICLFTASFLTVRAQQKTALSKDQVSMLKKEGNELYKYENYKEALKIYQQVNAADPEDADVSYKLGVSYLNSNINKKKAIDHLKNLAGKKDVPKDILFQIGVALFYNNEFNEAIESFEKYKEENKGKVNPKLMLDQRIEWCYHALELMKNPIDVNFKNLGKNVNSSTADFRPVCGANDSILYFSSSRKGTMGGSIDNYGEYTTDIFFTSSGDTSRTKAKTAGNNLNSEAYEEALYLSPNGDKMLVYREGGDADGDIYYSELKGKQWNKTIILGQQFLTKEKEKGASMSPDGKTIYFAAELKGTKGGKDIWKCERDTFSGNWSAPVNLGDAINTKFDEINPFIFYDGKTLFFASQGHNSMGGFDVFKSFMPDQRQGWTKPQNTGYPLNTVFDDTDFVLNGTGITGYISAVREEGYGETDIYKVSFKDQQISPPSFFIKIKILTPAGLPTKEAICTITSKSTGENFGTVMANSYSGVANYSLYAGSYRIKIRSPKSGKADDDFTVEGNEQGYEKEMTYILK